MNGRSDFDEFIILCKNAFENNSLRNIVFSKLNGDEIKIKAKPVCVSETKAVCFERFLTEGRVVQKNVAENCFEEEIRTLLSRSRQADLSAGDGQATLLISKKGKAKLLSKIKNFDKKVDISQNNRQKSRIFEGNEGFLKELGVSDTNGRVHDKKQGKFRQINRFAEQIRDIEKYLPKDRTVYVADLCCGKSYLSFAAYYYLTEIRGYNVSMTCIDLKQSVIEYCKECAEKLGFTGMSFICSDVSAFEFDVQPDLVISLHACDVATDIVLDRAAAHRAKVILSTPCCQKELSSKLNNEELSFITKYPHLKMKFAATATDALRGARLEAAGYKVDIFEFTDPEDTPKNTMIRAVAKDYSDMSCRTLRKSVKTYNDTYRFLCGDFPPKTTQVIVNRSEGIVRKNKYDRALSLMYSDDVEARLSGASEIEALFENGYLPTPEYGERVNNHIHTTYSFSPYTPTAAVFEAKKAGLRTCGIMDHDSISGADEFIKAGKIFKIPTTCGCELRVKVSDDAFSTRRLNNPDQIGCAYVAMHGIPHGSFAGVEEFLKPLREARNKRNAAMIDNINRLTEHIGIKLCFKDVECLSSAEHGGSITERHVLFALVNALISEYPDREECLKTVELLSDKSIDEKKKTFLIEAPETLYPYDLLGVMKSGLIEKIYIPATDELCEMSEFTAFAEKIGAVSAYAYLGDVGESPTGDKKAQKFEDDYLEELFDMLKRTGFDAVTFMPSRNTSEQLERIMTLCRKYDMFMISGEDINSPRQSFVCEAADDAKFDILKNATWALIGHENAATEDLTDAMFAKDGNNSRLTLDEKLDLYSRLGKKTEKEYIGGKNND